MTGKEHKKVKRKVAWKKMLHTENITEMFMLDGSKSKEAHAKLQWIKKFNKKLMNLIKIQILELFLM